MTIGNSAAAILAVLLVTSSASVAAETLLHVPAIDQTSVKTQSSEIRIALTCQVDISGYIEVDLSAFIDMPLSSIERVGFLAVAQTMSGDGVYGEGMEVDLLLAASEGSLLATTNSPLTMLEGLYYFRMQFLQEPSGSYPNVPFQRGDKDLADPAAPLVMEGMISRFDDLRWVVAPGVFPAIKVTELDPTPENPIYISKIIRTDESTYLITFPTQSGYVYMVEGSPDLALWSLTDATVSGSGGEESLEVASAPSSREMYYWRVVVQPSG